MRKEIFKTFSFSTTIRNPQRNVEFLQALSLFNGYELNANLAQNYFLELVKNGIYTLKNTPQNLYEKLLNDRSLSNNELQTLFSLNPQIASVEKIHFRFKTHLEALAYQGLLVMDKNRIFISKLGFSLLENKIPSTEFYTKTLIGLHYHNPTKSYVSNKARVFLNTLFVLDTLKQQWQNLGFEAKGILKHEFQSFVLGMKDCNYLKCVEEILKYRKIYKYAENTDYLQNYLFVKEGVKRVKYNTLNDYGDEVFRKFEASGLLVKRGAFKNLYYDFSSFNFKKIESILQSFKNYEFETFRDTYEYIDFLDSITLPYLSSKSVKKEVLEQKAKTLHLDTKDLDFSNLEALEDSLNATFYQEKLKDKIQESSLEVLIYELKNLALNKESNHKEYKAISEPLRLEYLLALILGKKYGLQALKSNLIYSENGDPLSFAPAGKSDLEFRDFLIEATMIRNKNQQLNSETTSIARHSKEKQSQTQIPLRTLLIAPLIHFDTALFFKFCAKEFSSKIAPLSLLKFLDLLESSPTFQSFQSNFDSYVSSLLTHKTQDYLRLLH